jgi:hypothetical protein
LIALLAILGVDLIVIVAFAVFVFGRRRCSNASPANLPGRSECRAATSTA